MKMVRSMALIISQYPELGAPVIGPAGFGFIGVNRA
jgi:hypothetical protein